MQKAIETNNGLKGGLLKGKAHYDSNGNPLGGIKAVVTDQGGKPIEVEGNEVIINKKTVASEKILTIKGTPKEILSTLNQMDGNGVAIGDEEAEILAKYRTGGRISKEKHKLYLGEEGGMGVSPKGMFDSAVQMENEGIDSETIRSITGWFRNPFDKLWRFEISDREAKINLSKIVSTIKKVVSSKSEVTLSLKDVYTNNELSKAYGKSIEELPFMFYYDDEDEVLGRLNIIPLAGKVFIKLNVYEFLRGNVGEVESTVAERGKLFISFTTHELQHAIQIREGLSAGGSVEQEYRKLLKEHKGVSERKDRAENNRKTREDVLLEQARLNYLNHLGEIEASDSDVRKFFDKKTRIEIPPYSLINFNNEEVIVVPETKIKFRTGGSVPTEINKLSLNEFEKYLEEKYNSKVELGDYKKYIYLSRIEVDKETRGLGIGSEIMSEIINYADYNDKKITLTPSTDYGASSVARLKDFYKNFGFVENKGRNKDFEISQLMYRVPKVNKYHLGGDMTKHLAPNGKPSNLNHEQWHLVRTPEFLEFFGDWINSPETASKVVDENGEPLMVYHGTSKEFTVFSLEKVGSNVDYGMWGSGFYFSPLKSFSKNYGSKLLKLFLNIRNPFVRNPSIQGSKSQFKPVYGKDESIELRNKIINSNYDGVLQFESGEKNPLTQIVAFEPNQIKLADGSNTTFDENNDDIRFNDGGGVNDNFKNPILINGFISNKKIDGKEIFLITYNSGGQEGLNVHQTMNPLAMLDAVEKKTGLHTNTLQVFIYEHTENSNRIETEDELEFLKDNYTVIIVDRDSVEFYNGLKRFKGGGELSKKALAVETNDLTDFVRKYFIKDGRIDVADAMQELFGNRRGKSIADEYRKRIGLHKKGGLTISQLAHNLWEQHKDEVREGIDDSDFRNAVEEVLISEYGVSSMIKSLIEKSGESEQDKENEFWMNQFDEGDDEYYEDLSDEEVADYFKDMEGFESELAKGTEHEMEHLDTLKKVAEGKITPEQAVVETASKHLEENKNYYEDLAKMEAENKGIKIGTEFYDYYEPIKQRVVSFDSERVFSVPVNIPKSEQDDYRLKRIFKIDKFKEILSRQDEFEKEINFSLESQQEYDLKKELETKKQLIKKDEKDMLSKAFSGSKLQVGKKLVTLRKLIKYNGLLYTLKEYIDKIFSELNDDEKIEIKNIKNEPHLSVNNSTYKSLINETGLEYFKYLLSLKEQQEESIPDLIEGLKVLADSLEGAEKKEIEDVIEGLEILLESDNKFAEGGGVDENTPKVKLATINKIKKLANRIMEIYYLNLGDEDDIYSYSGDLSFRERRKLFEETKKLEAQLTEITDTLSKSQCESIDNENFQALNAGGDFGHEDEDEFARGGELDNNYMFFEMSKADQDEEKRIMENQFGKNI